MRLLMGLSELLADNALVRLFRGGSQRHDFTVTMAGVKLGDRVLVVGSSDGTLLAALGQKTGLSGRTSCIDHSLDKVKTAGAIAERAGVLVEVATFEGDRIPYDDDSFDLVVIEDPSWVTDRARGLQVLLESLRVLRPGGRTFVIVPLSGRPAPATAIDDATATDAAEIDVLTALKVAGFRPPRVVASKGKLSFVEAIKGRH